MKRLHQILTHVKQTRRQPDFENLLKILKRQVPSPPTPFEFTLNNTIYEQVTDHPVPAETDAMGWCRYLIEVFYKLGYDVAVIGGWHLNALVFSMGEKRKQYSKSLNEGAVITDLASFEAYPWPELETAKLAPLETMNSELPDGMKLVCCGLEGVLEMAIDLVGFENLCLLSCLQPELTQEIFDHIGCRILEYYEHVVQFDSVAAIISNDEWGFKTQTMLSPDDLRRWVFPWHKKIVSAAHRVGKPAILHSCGNLEAVYDDIFDDMKFDGKHSFEDIIRPVESAIVQFGDRIAIIGGIDMDDLASRSAEYIFKRTKMLVNLSLENGGVAIGSGNSIPEYVPTENYCAMLEAVLL